MTERPEIVLITGAARSGTSMVAGVLQASGLDLGSPLVGATRYNPRGFFEHRHIRQKVLKPLLKSMGCDPRGQRNLPPRSFLVAPQTAQRLRKRVRRYLGSGWGYKDAKILLTWPIWRQAFPNARWVLVRRDPAAIVKSCIRTPFMKGRTYKAGWIAWVKEHELRLDDLKNSGVKWVECWPDPDEPESFREAVEFCGLTYEPTTVATILEPGAWHRK